MSRLLHDAVIQALNEAHCAYLTGNIEKYRDSLKVAECGIDAIRSLGTEDSCGRQMEIMGLQAEISLMRTMACIHSPVEMIPHYETAMLQMLLPPSQVISKEAPMIAHCENTLDFFGGACEQTADWLEKATEMYGYLTGGGGGGVAEIYRAQIAKHNGNHIESEKWAQLAMERMCGDKWIEPIAGALMNKTG